MFDPTLNEKPSQIDWPLWLAAAGLMVIGVLFVYSATSVSEAARALPLYKQTFFHQIVWCGLGVAAALALSLLDYVSIARFALVLYWLAIAALVAVLIVGSIHNGSKRWVSLGPFNLQPSEFAKIAFIFMQANFLSRPLEELRRPEVVGVAIGMAVLPFVFILKEPDLGSALVFIPVTLVMLFVAGVSRRFLAWMMGIAGFLVVSLVVAILFLPPQLKIVESYQRDRLLVYFGRDLALRNATPEDRQRLKKELRENSYNVEQSLISVGSGGFWGRGWRQGTQYALGFLPKLGAHNDFIFSVIAEEEGFVGSSLVLLLYTVLLFSGLRIASQARDRLGSLLAVGVVTLLFSHVFINIGMNIRLVPVTGIPLPLLSYGGSSVVCSLIAIGLLHNIHIHRRSY